jgi:hypothetical protein
VLGSFIVVIDHMSTVWPIEHMYSQQDRSLSEFIGCLKAAVKTPAIVIAVKEISSPF